MPLSSRRYEAISKSVKVAPLRDLKKKQKNPHFHSIVAAKTSPGSNGVFSALYWLAPTWEACGEWCILYSQQGRTQNQPTEAFLHLAWSEKRTMNMNLMRSGTRKPTCFPKYTLDYHKHKRLRNTRSVQINLFFAHNLKGSVVFSPLCDYLFICLLIYFSLPRVQRARVWCALVAVFTKGEGRLLLHSGQREEKETCLLICCCIIKASD